MNSTGAAALWLILSAMIARPCFADGVQRADRLLRYRTIGDMQGMYEVREEARKFLARQSPPTQGKWTALLPDVRTFVPTCAVPFRTRWAAASDHEDGMPGVMVICPKSTDKTYKRWNAFVGAAAREEPTELLKYRTTSHVHGLYEIHEEAVKFLSRQPRKKSGEWVAVGPDIRMQVPRCAVPLRTRWARESDDKENLPGVLVICKKNN